MIDKLIDDLGELAEQYGFKESSSGNFGEYCFYCYTNSGLADDDYSIDIKAKLYMIDNEIPKVTTEIVTHKGKHCDVVAMRRAMCHALIISTIFHGTSINDKSNDSI